MIHLLYPTLCKLMNALQRKFVKKIKLSSDDTTKNVYINVGDDRKIKPFSKMNGGMKANTLFSQNVMMASDTKKKLRQDCLDFFVTTVQNLRSNLPYDTCLYCNMPNIFTLINTMLRSH